MRFLSKMSFIEFRLKKGDIVSGQIGVALLVRETRNYWYYFLNGHKLRINKKSLWALIDSNKLVVNYGNSMKHRRKKRKDRSLDLHGVLHSDVDNRLRKFLNFVELPCRIITGNSEKMKEIVKNTVKDYDWVCYSDDINTGVLVVREK